MRVILDQTPPSAHTGAGRSDPVSQTDASSDQRLSAVISGPLQAGKSLVIRGLQSLHIKMLLWGSLPGVPSRRVASPVDSRSPSPDAAIPLQDRYEPTRQLVGWHEPDRSRTSYGDPDESFEV